MQRALERFGDQHGAVHPEVTVHVDPATLDVLGDAGRAGVVRRAVDAREIGEREVAALQARLPA